MLTHHGKTYKSGPGSWKVFCPRISLGEAVVESIISCQSYCYISDLTGVLCPNIKKSLEALLV